MTWRTRWLSNGPPLRTTAISPPLVRSSPWNRPMRNTRPTIAKIAPPTARTRMSRMSVPPTAGPRIARRHELRQPGDALRADGEPAIAQRAADLVAPEDPRAGQRPDQRVGRARRQDPAADAGHDRDPPAGREHAHHLVDRAHRRLDEVQRREA